MVHAMYWMLHAGYELGVTMLYNICYVLYAWLWCTVLHISIVYTLLCQIALDYAMLFYIYVYTHTHM